MTARPAAGFIAAVLAIVVAVGVYLAVAASRQEHAARAADSQRAVLALERLGAAVLDAESSHRGWLLAQRPAELARHERAVAAVRAELSALTARAEREPSLRERTEALVSIVDAALAEMREARRARDAAVLQSEHGTRGVRGARAVLLP